MIVFSCKLWKNVISGEKDMTFVQRDTVTLPRRRFDKNGCFEKDGTVIYPASETDAVEGDGSYILKFDLNEVIWDEIGETLPLLHHLDHRTYFTYTDDG